MQSNLQPGDLVITSAGLHGRIVSLAESTVDLELSPGVVVTMEKVGVLRAVNPNANPPAPVMGEGVDDSQEGPSSYWDDQPGYEEQRPESLGENDRRDHPGDDHPENLR